MNNDITARQNKENEMAQDLKRDNLVTGFPIDVVYDCVGHDNSEKGFNDAMVSSDTAYLETGKNLIKNDLNKVIDQTILKYKDNIKRLDSMIDYNDSLGMRVLVMELKAEKDIFLSHIDEMSAMKKQLEDLETTNMNSIRSYERGFKRGTIAKTELALNEKQTNL